MRFLLVWGLYYFNAIDLYCNPFAYPFQYIIVVLSTLTTLWLCRELLFSWYERSHRAVLKRGQSCDRIHVCSYPTVVAAERCRSATKKGNTIWQSRTSLCRTWGGVIEDSLKRFPPPGLCLGLCRVKSSFLQKTDRLGSGQTVLMLSRLSFSVRLPGGPFYCFCLPCDIWRDIRKKHLWSYPHKCLKFMVSPAWVEHAAYCLGGRRPYFSLFFIYFYYLVFLDSYKCHILPRFSSFGIILTVQVGNRVGK